jgi:hypothetical protein
MNGRRDLASTWLLAALVAVISVGCSHGCNVSDIAGSYQMQDGSDNYELRLTPEGLGALTLNGVQVETLGWDLEPSNGQVFIHVSRATIELLKRLAGEPKIPSDGPQWKSGYFGLMPICGRLWNARRLELGPDSQRYFSKTP